MSKVLLVGATGFVGGTVLHHLLSSERPTLRPLVITLLVRSPTCAEKLIATYGSRINIIHWPGGLSNASFIADTAANFDVVLNVGTGFVPEGAAAFVEGLARRIGNEGNRAPWMINISGCTNLADRPLTQKAMRRTWSDRDALSRQANFKLLKEIDAKDPYPQRTAELRVLETAVATGVHAVSVNPGVVFGEGKGLFNNHSHVVPRFTKYVLQHGYGFKLTETANFDYVHVDDLSELFLVILDAVLGRADQGVGFVPTGKQGIVFAQVGRNLITEMMDMCLSAAFAEGVLPREDTPKGKEIRQVGLQEIADETMSGLVEVAERSLAGWKAMDAVVAKTLLGWKPRYGEEAWREEFTKELHAVRAGRRGNNLVGATGGK